MGKEHLKSIAFQKISPDRPTRARLAGTVRSPASPLSARRLPLLALLTYGILRGLPAAATTPQQTDESRPHRFADDARLERKVSLTAWAEPLEDLLVELSRETGVKLRFDGRDVGDQRVNLVLKDQPLWRVQSLLAKTLDLYWLRDRKAPEYRYTLLQDVRSRKAEEELMALARRRYEEGLHRLVDSLKLTPTEIEGLRARNRSWASWLSEPPRRIAIGLLGRLNPSQWQQLIEIGELKIPYANLSSTDQELIRQYVEQSNKGRDRADQERGTPGRHHIGDVTQPGGQIFIKVFGGVPPGPDSELDFGVRPADGHEGGHGLGLGYTDEELHQIREEITSPKYRQDKERASSETQPRVTVTWKQKPDRWEKVLKAVAERAGLQIVSDSYLYHWWEWNMDLPDAARLQDRPLSEVLDRICEPFLYVWRRDGDVYLFRQRNWFLEKQNNVPERDIRRWRRHLEQGGRLELEDLAELALLTDRQVRSLWGTDIPTGGIAGHRELLRLYAALTPPQRAKLGSTGLPVEDLSPVQMALLRAWQSNGASDRETVLRMSREPDAVTIRMERRAAVSREERVQLGPRRVGAGSARTSPTSG
jgi:hypothetical protein